MNSTVKTSGRFSKSRGLRASVSFLPFPHPLPSTFLLSPYFSRGSNVKNSLALPEFRPLRTGTLATQAKLHSNLSANHSDFKLRDVSRTISMFSNKISKYKSWAYELYSPWHFYLSYFSLLTMKLNLFVLEMLPSLFTERPVGIFFKVVRFRCLVTVN